jgi:hypothetical protein
VNSNLYVACQLPLSKSLLLMKGNHIINLLLVPFNVEGRQKEIFELSNGGMMYLQRTLTAKLLYTDPLLTQSRDQ